MNILVCLKQILDPDIPARDFQIDPDAKEAVRGAAELVANIFCENALETALRLRDASGGRITVVSYGDEETEDALRKALAMKADEAVLVEKEGAAHPDAASVAQVLAAAARELGGFDLVLVGRESGDWGVGQTGAFLAEELGAPFVALVDQIETTDGDRPPEGPEGGHTVRVRRQTDTGFEILEARTPVVVSITNSDGNLPRIPKTRDIMKSARKPLKTFQLAELDVDADAVRGGAGAYELVELFVPEKEVRCEMVEGDSLDEKIDAFARRVAEAMDAAS